MAWEERNGHQYYYLKRREGDRVISEYIGSGLAAELYAKACLKNEESIQRERERRREMTAISAQVDDICKTLNNAVRAWLLALGYHQHKRQWRKRRNDRG